MECRLYSCIKRTHKQIIILLSDSMFMRHMKMGEYNKWDEQKNKKKYTGMMFSHFLTRT